MAKKEETISLIDTFSEFKDTKNIDRTTMVSVLEESFRSVIAKMFGSDKNYDVIVNPDKGDFEIWRNRVVVEDEELTNENMQISLTEAQKIDASYEVGEEVTDEVAEDTVECEEAEVTDETPSLDPPPEELVLQHERQRELKRAVAQLSQSDRVIFYRKYYYLQTTAQIASEIGMTERAIEGRLYRIKKRLRKLLGGDGNA